VLMCAQMPKISLLTTAREISTFWPIFSENYRCKR
jgi:hypothetical protein